MYILEVIVLRNHILLNFIYTYKINNNAVCINNNHGPVYFDPQWMKKKEELCHDPVNIHEIIAKKMQHLKNSSILWKYKF